MISPPILQRGDVVAITCPAKKLPNGVTDAVRLLESWGLRVKVGKTTENAYFQFAGTDEERAAEMQQFLDDKELKAIFAARGGYGSVRIIDKLNFEALKTYPKWLIGFSDITVFHSHLHAQLQIETLHAQMPLNVPEASKTSLQTLKKALFGKLDTYEWESTTDLNVSGKAQGELIGGNLSILVNMEHSISEMDYKDKILFIEDVGEAHYALDRMLYQLKRSGKLAVLKGLIVGGFSNLKDTSAEFGQTVEEMIITKVKEYTYPVAFQFSAGHIKNNCALIFGRKISLEVSNKYAKISL